VALCTYNGAQFLAEQLTSIARQTRMPDEIILLDDRSTDSTLKIARAVCAEYGLPCSIHCNETRLGVEANFSHAMLRTHGDVIFFCDQDDVWKAEKVKKMLAPFEQNRYVTLVYSDGDIVGPQLETTGVTLFTKNPDKQLEQGDMRNIGQRLRNGQSPGIKASSLAFSSVVRDLAGPLPEGVAHDSWIAFFGYALGKVVAIPESLHLYRRHDHTSGKSSSNALISGLHPAKKTLYSDRLQEKARLARCLDERMCWLKTHSDEQEIHLGKRFAALQVDAQLAARTLSARAAIAAHPKRMTRLRKGLWALLKGDYRAMTGIHHQLRTLLKDIRQ